MHLLKCANRNIANQTIVTKANFADSANDRLWSYVLVQVPLGIIRVNR